MEYEKELFVNSFGELICQTESGKQLNCYGVDLIDNKIYLICYEKSQK